MRKYIFLFVCLLFISFAAAYTYTNPDRPKLTVPTIITSTGGGNTTNNYYNVTQGSYNATYDTWLPNWTAFNKFWYNMTWTGGAGGNPFDQTLNTTDNVIFNSANLTSYLNIIGSGGGSSVAFLIVAGGGGGGRSQNGNGGNGGGGAGGLIYNSNYTVSVTSYPIVIGTGGAGATVNNNNGSNGGNSSFAGYNAGGGGGGGGPFQGKGVPGGSGGGSGQGGAVNAGGNGISGQGNKGGDSQGTNYNSAPGGGGAGAVGGNVPSTNAGGGGGIGLQYSINGTNIYYAGGGGGGNYNSGTQGQGGLGGGGNGASGSGNQVGYNGTNGLGGGGGGSQGANVGGNGGSGVVIISYPTGTISATGGTITTSGGNTIHTFTSNGTFQVTSTGVTNYNNIIKSSSSQTANINYTLPPVQGGINTYLSNDGSGVLSWTSVSSSGTYNSTYATWLPNYTAFGKYWYNMSGGSGGSMDYTNVAMTNKTNTFNADQNVNGNLNVTGKSIFGTSANPFTNYPYEAGWFQTDADTKFGVYSGGGFGTGEAITLGYTSATDINGYHPGFEIQDIGGYDILNNYLRFNFLERNNAGVVVAAKADILDIYGNGDSQFNGNLNVNGNENVFRNSWIRDNEYINTSLTDYRFQIGGSSTPYGYCDTPQSNSDCSQFTQEGDCTAYSNHNGDCTPNYEPSSCTGWYYDSCGGTETACDIGNFGTHEACDAQAGCSAGYTDCSSIQYPDCLNTEGCVDEGSYCDGSGYTTCGGTATSCSISNFPTASSCTAQAGCSPSYGGDCTNYNNDGPTCQALGCSWTPQAFTSCSGNMVCTNQPAQDDCTSATCTWNTGTNDVRQLIFDSNNNFLGIGVAPQYPLHVMNMSDGISGWFEGNVSAAGYITRTEVYDSAKEGSALDKIGPSSELLNKDGTTNHTAFGYSYVSYPIKIPVGYTMEPQLTKKCTTTTPLPGHKAEQICQSVTTYTKVVHYIDGTEEGVDLGKEVALQREAIFELKTQNQDLQSQITARDKCTASSKDYATYQTCIGKIQ